MKTNRLFFTLIFFQLLCPALHAQQNPQPYFRNYSTEHGLPSPEVYCIFEDSRGYMWFGTDNGAARFDGYEFKVYGPKEGLTSNVVFDIHEDGKGRIWFGTMAVEAFILEGDTIIPSPYNSIIQGFQKKSNRGTLAYLDKNETAFFELRNYGFIKIDSLGIVDTIRGKLPVSQIVMDIEGDDESMRTTSKFRKHPDYNEFEKKLSDDQSSILDIISDGKRFQKKIFFSSSLSGLSGDIQKLNTGEWLHYAGATLSCISDTSLLWSIDNIPATEEIISTEKGEIWMCHLKGTGLRWYKNLNDVREQKYQQYLSGLSVSNMFQDSKGGCWVTTQEKGIFYCPDFKLLTYNTQFGLPGDFVTNVAFKNNQELFVGTKNGYFTHIDYDQGEILSINKFPKGSSFQQYSLNYYNEHLFYGFSKWKNSKWHFPEIIHSVTKEKYQVNMILTRLDVLSENRLIGVQRSGIFILDTEKNFVEIILNQGPRNFAVYSDTKNQIWIGNSKGIFKLKNKTLIPSGISNPSFNNRVEDIAELPDSTLVFGTKGYGVTIWQGEDIIQITNEDGLTSNMLEDIHVDKNGILWAGTLNGLNKITFDKTGKTIVRTFTTFNGLPSNEIYQIKSYKGQVWLCTAGGLVKFNEATENTFSPSPILQWAKINDKEKDLTNTSFSYDQNNFEFRYLAINYRMNGKIPYRYRISSKEDWKYTQNLNVNYPSLPPDDYTFEVQSQNEDGYWSKSTIYDFTVQPPWWATWWFRTLSILAIGWLGYTFYKYRTNQIRRESDLKNQMTDLEKSALQAQMNPHFIFNSLNSIQNFILKNDTKNAVEYLSRFARLVRHNLNASVQGMVTLEEEISILDNYLALERERFEQRFDYQIEVDPEIEKSFMEFPPMLIQPYVENAVVHGISKKEGQGIIKVEFRKDNENLLVTIQDNGIGYRQGQDGAKSKRHKSVGMTITQKRLELLGNADDAVQIKTLTNKHNEQQGTQVQILIKTK